MTKKAIKRGLLLIAAALGLVIGFCGTALCVDHEGTWYSDIEAAADVAKKNKLNLFVLFTGSDWCPMCVKLHNEVVGTQEFREATKNKFVLVMLDFPRTQKMLFRQVQQNERLARKYRIEGFPTVILLDSKGRPYARTGYQPGGATDYVVHLDQLDEKLRNRDELFALSERAEGKARAELLDRALMSLQEDGVLQDYDSEIDEVIKFDPNNEAGLKEKYETGRKFIRIVSLIQEQRFQEAQTVISESSLKADAPIPSRQRLLYLKAVVLHGLGEESSEIRVLNEAIALDPSSPLSHHLRSIISEHQVDQKPIGQE
ncbi:MAG: thioredoxin fold domain-containing protein [Planctomycetes bacterium]|nr:thioredoxin fold domain-containing protein [Planctomycetota bacterium]